MADTTGTQEWDSEGAEKYTKAYYHYRRRFRNLNIKSNYKDYALFYSGMGGSDPYRSDPAPPTWTMPKPPGGRL